MQNSKLLTRRAAASRWFVGSSMTRSSGSDRSSRARPIRICSKSMGRGIRLEPRAGGREGTTTKEPRGRTVLYATCLGLRLVAAHPNLSRWFEAGAGLVRQPRSPHLPATRERGAWPVELCQLKPKSLQHLRNTRLDCIPSTRLVFDLRSLEALKLLLSTQ